MKKGFTLIELLAVIAVLAIVLIIAIPNVISIISDSKKAAFKKDEATISKAAANYLAANLSLIPANVGNTTTVLYTDLKSNGYISPIIDQTNGSECTKSKVFVLKQADGTLKYTPGIICDNYISIDAFDVLNGVGKYFTDSNADGIANGWIMEGSGTSTNTLDTTYTRSHTSSQKIQALTLNVGLSLPSPYYITIENGKKYYAFVYTRATVSYNFVIGTSHYDGTYGNLAIPTSSSWQLTSNLFTASNTQMFMYSTQTGTTYIDSLVILNLTDMYGAGNELTKAQMDALITKS